MGNEGSKGGKGGSGGSGGAPPPTQRRPQTSSAVQTTQKLAASMDRLTKRQTFLEKKIQHELKQAKAKHKAGNKRQALIHMKRTKMYEKEIPKLEVAIMNIEQQTMSNDSAEVNAQIVGAMRTGANAQKAINKQINIESVEDLRDDIEEQQQMGEEINNLLGEPMGGALEDDFELEDELAALENEEMDDLASQMPELPSAGKTVLQSALGVLPEAPSHEVNMSEEDAELRALEAEMMAG